jgi:hypothetical protein
MKMILTLDAHRGNDDDNDNDDDMTRHGGYDDNGDDVSRTVARSPEMSSVWFASWRA